MQDNENNFHRHNQQQSSEKSEHRSPYFSVNQYPYPLQQQQPQQNNRTPLESIDSNNTARTNNLRVEREACREHPEEEVNYFCFDCINCAPICSECVIHGFHKGHSVSTVKRAYP